ncbi:NAD-dependent protein deacylase [Lactovum odontotermitis]
MATAKNITELISASERLVFMTGAGVSTPSGIPDYRSMDGIYTTSSLKKPEYLLSHRAMLHDTDDFYAFIKQLYHPEARPNVIHRTMAKLEENHRVTVITQNIDGLHKKAGSSDVIEFHGTLAACRCEKCGAAASAENFLKSYIHEDCGGIIRPNVVLYDESINPENIQRAVNALSAADTIVIAGTSFQVFPFASLIDYANPEAKILAVNKTPLSLPNLTASFVGDASEVFNEVFNLRKI